MPPNNRKFHKEATSSGKSRSKSDPIFGEFIQPIIDLFPFISSLALGMGGLFLRGFTSEISTPPWHYLSFSDLVTYTSALFVLYLLTIVLTVAIFAYISFTTTFLQSKATFAYIGWIASLALSVLSMLGLELASDQYQAGGIPTIPAETFIIASFSSTTLFLFSAYIFWRMEQSYKARRFIGESDEYSQAHPERIVIAALFHEPRIGLNKRPSKMNTSFRTDQKNTFITLKKRSRLLLVIKEAIKVMFVLSLLFSLFINPSIAGRALNAEWAIETSYSILDSNHINALPCPQNVQIAFAGTHTLVLRCPGTRHETVIRGEENVVLALNIPKVTELKSNFGPKPPSSAADSQISSISSPQSVP